jgi:hypothetical protein
MILIAIPSLFAAGAGAISVSQEKESRTLGWLTSMPIPRGQLVATKFFSAVVCWLGLWMAVVIIARVCDQFQYSWLFPHADYEHPLHSFWICYWMANSFYLLVAGFVTAWWFGSSFGALMAFVPLAIAPYLLRSGLTMTLNPSASYLRPVFDTSLSQNLCLLAIGLFILFWLNHHFSVRALAPQEVSPSKRTNPYSTGDSVSTMRHLSTSDAVVKPSSALLWQFYQQNQLAYLVLLGVALLVGLGTFYGLDRPTIVFGAMTGLLASIWLGVLTFQGDGLHQRIRFLADRGLSPVHVWVTRQVLPWGAICLITLGYLVLLLRSSLAFDERLPLWLILSGLGFCLGYGQWWGLVVRNPILAVLGAPVVVGTCFLYGIFSWQNLCGEWKNLYLLVMGIAPFVATLWTMESWMERRLVWSYWGRHLSVLLVVIGLPLASFGLYYWNYPRLPRELRARLWDEGRKLPAPLMSQHISLNRWSGEDDIGENEGSAHGEPIGGKSHQLDFDSRAGIAVSDSDLTDLISSIALDRFRLEQAPDNTKNLLRYRERLEILRSIAVELRKSTSLKSQAHADLAERRLIVELEHPQAKERMTKESWENSIELVGDSQGRNAARRRAVLASWCYYTIHLGHAENPVYVPGISEYQVYGTRPRATHSLWVDNLVGVLIGSLEMPPTESIEKKREFLDRQSTTLPSRYFHPQWVHDPHGVTPISQAVPLEMASQWFAEWERVGMRLKDQR